MSLSREGMALVIYDTRRSLHMTQAELAQEIGTTAPTVSTWERGQKVPSPSYIIRLSKALGITPNDLMGWPKDPSDKHKSGFYEATQDV